MFRVLPIVILQLVVNNILCGQNFEVTQYNVREGLPQSQITSLLEDDFGYLWIGTRGGGLSYFDGKQFKTYTRDDGLMSNLVLSLFKTKEGDLWLGGRTGVQKFDGLEFKSFVLEKRIQKIFQFYDTLFCYDQQFQLTKIYKDSVIGTSDSEHVASNNFIGVYNNSTTGYYTITKQDQLFYNNHAGAHLIKLNGLKPLGVHFVGKRIWLNTNEGTFEIDENQKLNPIEPRVRFPVVLYERSDAVWYKGQNGLVREEFGSTGRKQLFEIGSNHYVGLIDREGIIWIGTNGQGLFKYQVSEFERINGIDGMVTSVLKDGANIWVGTKHDGLYLIQNDQIKRHYQFGEAGQNSVSSIRRDNHGKIWLGTDVGLGRVNQHKELEWFTRRDGLSSDSITDIAFDNANRVWLTFKSGSNINVYDGNDFKVLSLQDSINPGRFYQMVYVEQQDRIYVATDNSVLYIQDERFERLQIPGYRKSAAYSIDRFKKDYLVIGYAARGIALYDITNEEVRHYARPQGPTVIYFTGTDAEDFVWLGNELGIARLRFNNELEIAEFLHFGKIHGHENNQSSFNSYDIGSKDKYFGLTDGLYKFVGPVQVVDQPLHLTSVELFYGEEQISSYSDSLASFFKFPYQPVFPSKMNHLTFSFGQVNKLNPEAVVYKYILEGFEKHWSPPTRQNKVTYSSIGPGKYTFKVIGIDRNGLWEREPLSYSFTVTKPFYLTNIFVMGCVVLLILLVFIIVYLRGKHQVKKALEIEQIRQQENAKLRKEIGRDFHDEMGNQLARIVNYASLAQLNSQDVSKTLFKIEESAKDLIVGTHDFIWALDVANGDVSNLFAHARDYGERLFNDSGIDFRPSYSIKTNYRLPFGYSRQVNLILKESMTNAYKHSRATWVMLTFEEDEHGPIFGVCDNGLGIALDVIENSDGGISNMLFRASKNNFNITITRGHNHKGTKIQLNLNIKLPKP